MLAFFKLMPYKTTGYSGCGTCRFAARRLRQARYMQKAQNFGSAILGLAEN